MFEVFWYWFIAMLKGGVTVKMRIVTYVSYKLDEMISADKAYIRFQYFVIYFN